MIGKVLQQFMKGRQVAAESLSVVPASDDIANAIASTPLRLYSQVISATTAGAIAAPTAGQHVAINHITVQSGLVGSAGQVTIASGAINLNFYTPVDGSGASTGFGGLVHMPTATAVGITLSAAVDHSVIITYLLIDDVTGLPV